MSTAKGPTPTTETRSLRSLLCESGLSTLLRYGLKQNRYYATSPFIDDTEKRSQTRDAEDNDDLFDVVQAHELLQSFYGRGKQRSTTRRLFADVPVLEGRNLDVWRWSIESVRDKTHPDAIRTGCLPSWVESILFLYPGLVLAGTSVFCFLHGCCQKSTAGLRDWHFFFVGVEWTLETILSFLGVMGEMLEKMFAGHRIDVVHTFHSFTFLVRRPPMQAGRMMPVSTLSRKWPSEDFVVHSGPGTVVCRIQFSLYQHTNLTRLLHGFGHGADAFAIFCQHTRLVARCTSLALSVLAWRIDTPDFSRYRPSCEERMILNFERGVSIALPGLDVARIATYHLSSESQCPPQVMRLLRPLVAPIPCHSAFADKPAIVLGMNAATAWSRHEEEVEEKQWKERRVVMAAHHFSTNMPQKTAPLSSVSSSLSSTSSFSSMLSSSSSSSSSSSFIAIEREGKMQRKGGGRENDHGEPKDPTLSSDEPRTKIHTETGTERHMENVSKEHDEWDAQEEENEHLSYPDDDLHDRDTEMLRIPLPALHLHIPVDSVCKLWMCNVQLVANETVTFDDFTMGPFNIHSDSPPAPEHVEVTGSMEVLRSMVFACWNKASYASPSREDTDSVRIKMTSSQSSCSSSVLCGADSGASSHVQSYRNEHLVTIHRFRKHMDLRRRVANFSDLAEVLFHHLRQPSFPPEWSVIPMFQPLIRAGLGRTLTRRMCIDAVDQFSRHVQDFCVGNTEFTTTLLPSFDLKEEEWYGSWWNAKPHRRLWTNHIVDCYYPRPNDGGPRTHSSSDHAITQSDDDSARLPSGLDAGWRSSRPMLTAARFGTSNLNSRLPAPTGGASIVVDPPLRDQRIDASVDASRLTSWELRARSHHSPSSPSSTHALLAHPASITDSRSTRSTTSRLHSDDGDRVRESAGDRKQMERIREMRRQSDEAEWDGIKRRIRERGGDPLEYAMSAGDRKQMERIREMRRQSDEAEWDGIKRRIRERGGDPLEYAMTSAMVTDRVKELPTPVVPQLAHNPLVQQEETSGSSSSAMMSSRTV